GGETSKRNLIALCTFHHTLVHEGGFTLERGADGLRFLAPDRTHLPSFHASPPAPTDPLEAFERAHVDLGIHDETGLTRWDGEPVHYGDVVEVLCAADEPGAADESGAADPPGHTDEPSAADELGVDQPGDLDL